MPLSFVCKGGANLRSDVANDLSKSAAAFRDIVWPNFARNGRLGVGSLLPVEAVETTEMRRTFDILAGIDAWQICDGVGRMRGIASRVQWIKNGSQPYDTFTIRTRRRGGQETELQKRLKAICEPDGGWLFPAITIQAYLNQDNTRCLSAAAVKSKDLFLFVHNTGLDNFNEQNNNDGSSSFINIPWRRLIREKIRVLEYRDGEIEPQLFSLDGNQFQLFAPVDAASSLATKQAIAHGQACKQGSHVQQAIQQNP